MLASITLETIERRRCSFDSAFQAALGKVRAGPEDRGLAYRWAQLALRHFAEADLVLESAGAGGIPLRRKCAFRVAYALVREGELDEGRVRAVRGGLLSNRLLPLLGREPDLSGLDEVGRLSVAYSTPRWIVEELVSNLRVSGARRVLEASWRRTLWVRVNTLKVGVDEAVERLERCGVRVRRDREVDFLLEVVGYGGPLSALPPFKRGEVVLQDRGSVEVVRALDPRPGELVLDMAAAPGLKTSLIEQLSGGGAWVVAVDVSARRMEEMRGLARRFGCDPWMVLADSTRAPLRGGFDKVLIDAPCTNSGALSSDPGLRLALWRRPDVKRYAAVQASMIGVGASLLREGGVMVYSVCSFLGEEGEAHFVRGGLPLALDPGRTAGLPGYRAYGRVGELTRRLYPHVHRTTGFFIARAVKGDG